MSLIYVRVCALVWKCHRGGKGGERNPNKINGIQISEFSATFVCGWDTLEQFDSTQFTKRIAHTRWAAVGWSVVIELNSTYLIPAVTILGLHDGLVHGVAFQSVDHVRHNETVTVRSRDHRLQGDVPPLARMLVRFVHLRIEHKFNEIAIGKRLRSHTYHQFSVQQTDFLQWRNRLHAPRQIVVLQRAAEHRRNKFGRPGSAGDLDVLLGPTERIVGHTAAYWFAWSLRTLYVKRQRTQHIPVIAKVRCLKVSDQHWVPISLRFHRTPVGLVQQEGVLVPHHLQDQQIRLAHRTCNRTPCRAVQTTYIGCHLTAVHNAGQLDVVTFGRVHPRLFRGDFRRSWTYASVEAIVFCWIV